MDICDLNFEVEKLESTEGVNSAQAATVALHKDWFDIKSVNVSVWKGLCNLFSSGWAQKEELESKKKLQVYKACEAFKEYYKQGEPRKGDHHANLAQVCQA